MTRLVILLFAATEVSGDDEADLRALALNKNLPTHHVFITYEDHTDTAAGMENIESQSGTATNIMPNDQQSIKSLHIDMNVVDELSPILEDSIIDKGTFDLYLQIDVLSLLCKMWTLPLPDPRDPFGLPAPQTPASPRLAAPHVSRRALVITITRLRASNCPWPPRPGPVWSPSLCRRMSMLIMKQRLEFGINN